MKFNQFRLLKSFRPLLIAITTFVIYYILARFGLTLSVANNQLAPVWPASGFSIAAILVFGFDAAFGIFAAALIANYQSGLPWLPCIVMGFGNAAEALIGAWLCQAIMTVKADYGNHTKVFLSIFAITIATALGGFIGATALVLGGFVPSEMFYKNFSTWWIGDLIGVLFFIPFVNRESIKRFVKINYLNHLGIKLIFLLSLSAILNIWVFFIPSGSAFLFIVFAPLLIAAIWFDSFWIYIISFITGMVATHATVHGQGPFAEYVLKENLFHLQLFYLGLGITSLGLGSLQEEGLRRRSVLSLVFGWVIAGLTFYSFFNANKTVNQAHFEQEVDKAQQEIDNALKDYIDLLDSGVSLFNVSENVTEDQWKIFIEGMVAKKESSGVETIGVIFPTKKLNRETFLKEHHLSDSRKYFNFKSAPGAAIAVLNPEMHLILTYIAPIKEKSAALGIDFSTDKLRYEAALRARDTGLITATKIVQLLTDQVPKPAFVLLAPIYKVGAEIKTQQQRQNAFVGLAQSAINIERFMLGALQKTNREVHLVVQFKNGGSHAPVVFSSPDKVVDSTNSIVHQIELAGQLITYTWSKSEKFQSSSSLAFSLISFFGSLTALLLAVMLSTLQNLTTTAQALAEKMTKEITEKNRNWKLLTETSPVGIYITDPAGDCSYVNIMWIQQTGLSLNESMGQGWIKAIHPDDLEKVKQHWSRLLQGHKFDCTYRFLHRDQSIVYVAGQSVALIDENNQVTGYLGTTQDITDAVQKNNALIAASRMSSLGEMASGVAHEINNPLSIVLGKVSLLSRLLMNPNIDVDKAKHFIGQIQDTSNRIAKIIKGLRAFARDASSEPFEVCSMKNVIQDTLELCSARFYAYDVKLIIPQNFPSNVVFWGRSEQIAQVLLNLLNNAFDAAYETEEKWVEVQIQNIEGLIRVSVIDSGKGIDEELRKKIFEPFFTTKEIGKGTGLGLSISKGIIETHKGSLEFDALAIHTTFVFALAEAPPQV